MLDKLNILFVRILLNLLSVLPLRTFPYVAKFGAFIICSIFKRERDISRAQLSLAFPGLKSAEITKLTKLSYKSLCLLVLECASSKKLLSKIQYPGDISKIENGFFKFSDECGIAEVNASGDGAVCLVSHTGNFELMAGFFINKGIPLTVIAREPNYKALVKVIEDFRASYGLEFLWREEMGNPKKLLRAIKTGRFLGALIDQDTSLESIYGNFFDMPCAHPRGPISIAVRMNKPVFLGFDARLADGTHQIFTKRINWEVYKDTLSLEELEFFILNEYCANLEEHIRRNPSQWVWWHRRWRRQEGMDPFKPISTVEYIQVLETKRANL